MGLLHTNNTPQMMAIRLVGTAQHDVAVFQPAMCIVSSSVSLVCTAVCTYDSYAHAECDMSLLALKCVQGGGEGGKERT